MNLEKELSAENCISLERPENKAPSVELPTTMTSLNAQKRCDGHARNGMMTGFAGGGRFSDMADFKKLHVWRKAHALALNIDHVAARIRPRRHSSLQNQLIRAAMSIGANIVEGRGKNSDAEFARYLRSSINSANELEYHLMTARDVNAISNAHYSRLTEQTIEVRKMLYGLIDRISARKAGKKPARR